MFLFTQHLEPIDMINCTLVCLEWKKTFDQKNLWLSFLPFDPTKNELDISVIKDHIFNHTIGSENELQNRILQFARSQLFSTALVVTFPPNYYIKPFQGLVAVEFGPDGQVAEKKQEYVVKFSSPYRQLKNTPRPIL